jgi:hypothetical protein
MANPRAGQKKPGIRPFIASWGIFTISLVALGVGVGAFAIALITYELIKVGNDNASRAADLASRPYLSTDPRGMRDFAYNGQGRLVPRGQSVDIAVVGRRAFFAAAMINHGPGMASATGFRVHPTGTLGYSWGFHFKLVRHPTNATQQAWVFPVGQSQVLSKVATLNAAEAGYLQRWIASGRTMVADVWYENDPYVPHHKYTAVVTYRQTGGTPLVGGRAITGSWPGEYADMAKCGCR